MSAFIYGSMEQPRTNAVRLAQKQPENKFIAAVAALIPADVLALHALVLTWTTETDDDGATRITNEPILTIAFFVLVGLSIALFLIGRGTEKWARKDSALLFIPAVAFIAWAAMLGTSALTPIIPDGFPRPGLWLGASAAAVLLIALHARLNPSDGN